MTQSTSTLLTLLLLLSACGASQTGATGREEAPVDYSYSELPRLQFNQLAMREGVPVHWFIDADSDGAIDPTEVRALRFYDTTGDWVEANEEGELTFTAEFSEAYARLVAARAMEPESERMEAVWREFAGTAPTLVYNDLRELPGEHRAFAAKMLEVGELIDTLYALQRGAPAMADRVASDAASRSLFRRNWGIGCVAESNAEDASCSAAPGAPFQPVGIYPDEMQENSDFCSTLIAAENTDDLLDPFTVVRQSDDESGEFVAVPYSEAFSEPMSAAAARLREAAEIIAADPDEGALVRYLRSAASAFETNAWFEADVAWAAMTAQNSRWYIRVGPDETYWDPCTRKAGFHMTLSLIDTGSLAWQERLAPVQEEMEEAIAALVDTYEPREIEFHLPAFIQIISNFGDSRDPLGGTIGQSLPNWGPVAEASNGRTVVMSTLFTDSDSVARGQTSAASLLSADALRSYASNPESGLMSTVLHEATHNLGPAQGYTYEGQTAADAFGGGMASMLEELKAQTGALFLVALLQEHGILTEEEARETYMDSVVWAFGHISRGMWNDGRRKAYSQLAAIQVGYLLDNGVLTWDPEATPASGQGRGAFSVDLSRFPEVARALMTEVMVIKSTLDADAATALADRYVGAYDGSGAFAANNAETVVPHAHIVQLARQLPRAALVYSIDL